MVQPIALKGGRFTTDPRLDLVHEYNLESLNYPVSEILTAEQLRSPRSYTWDVQQPPLNQGQTNRCVQFGICAELLAVPVKVNMDKVQEILDQNEIYYPAQQRDPWPGGEYPGATPVYGGTSVTAGMSVAKDLGFYTEYRWALSFQDFVTAIAFHGPGVIGVDFYDNMFNPDGEAFITVGGSLAGGHCMCVRGVHIVKIDKNKPFTWDNVDFTRSWLLIRNSWGEWGVRGDARMLFIEFLKLWPGGEFAIPVRRRA